MSILTARPTGWISWDFHVLDGEREVTTVDLSRLRERGAFSWDGEQYILHRESALRGVFVLENGGRVLAKAEKASFLSRRFEVTAGHRRMTFRAASPWRRQFVLHHGARQIGSLRPVRLLARTVTLDFPDDLGVPVKVFLLFLAVIMWRRAAAAAAGS